MTPDSGVLPGIRRFIVTKAERFRHGSLFMENGIILISNSSLLDDCKSSLRSGWA